MNFVSACEFAGLRTGGRLTFLARAGYRKHGVAMVDVMIGVVLLIGQALGDSAARRFPRLFEPGSDMSAAFGWLMIVILLMAGWCVVQAFG